MALVSGLIYNSSILITVVKGFIISVPDLTKLNLFKSFSSFPKSSKPRVTAVAQLVGHLKPSYKGANIDV